MPGKHARLAPSAAHRWINCPASVDYCEALKAADPNFDPPSIYAAEGSSAHIVAADVLENGGTALQRVGTTIEVDGFTFEVDREMAEYVRQYVEYVKSITTSDRYIEQKLKLEHEPRSFGTADVVHIDKGTCVVVDLKYGKGVRISAQDNPQLKLYALAAYNYFSLYYDIERFELHVAQPRLNHYDVFRLDREELLNWHIDVVNPVVADIHNGIGLFEPGEWCSNAFCPAKKVCPHRAKAMWGMLDFKDLDSPGEPAQVSDQALGEILAQGAKVRPFLSDMEDLARERLLGGADVPGWKMVEGRSIRKWKSEADAEMALRKTKLRVGDYIRKKLVTPAQLEQVTKGRKGHYDMKKQGFMSEHIEKPPGKPSLVSSADPRRAYSPFKNLDEEAAS